MKKKYRMFDLLKKICTPILSILLIFSEGSLLADTKVLIFTYAYNRPDFIEIQARTFQKFLIDDYEFVVFSDAKDPDMQRQIHEVCNRFDLRCIDVPQTIHSQPYLQRFSGENWDGPAVRNSNVVQYSLDQLGFQHEGLVALFDSDMFLTRKFSFKEFMVNDSFVKNGYKENFSKTYDFLQKAGADINYSLAGLPQCKNNGSYSASYLWIGLVVCDMPKLKDRETLSFNCGRLYDETDHPICVDAGGFSHYYLKNHPEALVRKITSQFFVYDPQIDPLILKKSGCDQMQIDAIQSGLLSIEFLEHGAFLHYRGGTNWDNKSSDFHAKKTKALNNYIETILQKAE